MKNNTHKELYNDKYTSGYMEEWSPEKIAKIKWLIGKLTLPERGTVLDFGCGNGVLTEIIRTILPNWQVYGSDLSESAIDNARQWFPECTFFYGDDPKLNGNKFDFVFSHHVFEHVGDLHTTFMKMVQYVADSGQMLHCLPCGNSGSFEHNLCLLRTNGIDPSRDGCFFFEGTEHVRRLTSDDFIRLAKEHHFLLDRQFYANQFYGAIEMITSSHPRLVLKMTDQAMAIDFSARLKTIILRTVLLSINALRMPTLIIHHFFSKRTKQSKHFFLFTLATPFYLFSKPLDAYLKYKRKKEYEQRHHECNGSEMCLLFSRNNTNLRK